MDAVRVIPRKFSVYRRMQLEWVERPDGGVLLPVVWSRRFVLAWAVTLFLFVGFGLAWGWVAARGGYLVLGAVGFCWVLIIFGVVLGIALHGAAGAARGGPVCEVDRRSGLVRLPREREEIPLTDVRLVRRVTFSLARDGTRDVTYANQLLIVTDETARPVATNYWPRSAGRRLARALGVEYRECGVARQDLDEWERAPASAARA